MTLGKMSKLVLGTAQLGMKYGVSNVIGQPDKDETFLILDTAWRSGINTFDTAAAYGSAEEVLGEWISARKLQDHAFVITKIGNTDIAESLNRLQLKKIHACLVHSGPDVDMSRVLQKLRIAKESGQVEHIGVSIYRTEDALGVLDMGVDHAQVPYNVLDRRLDTLGFFEMAKSRGITVFLRSPFLQGLLLMDPRDVPARLSDVVPHIEKFRSIAEHHGLSPLEAALHYALSHGGADHVVFGVESVQQLDSILLARKKDIPTSAIGELQNSFGNLDAHLVDPHLWNR